MYLSKKMMNNKDKKWLNLYFKKMDSKIWKDNFISIYLICFMRIMMKNQKKKQLKKKKLLNSKKRVNHQKVKKSNKVVGNNKYLMKRNNNFLNSKENK